MKQQDVIKAFANRLANHGYAYSDDAGTKMLDSAVRASSRFTGIQAVIDAMKADQIAAEKQAVKEILGEEKLLSELTDEQKNQPAKDNANAKALSNGFYNGVSSDTANAMTVEGVIKERKAYIFLEEYCGIQLPTRYWIKADGKPTYYGGENGSTGNDDTGAITGSDAGGSVTKTDRSIVPEEFNTYTAANDAAQIITTDKRAWVVNATYFDDTITANGSDYINAGAGNDQITVNDDGATVLGGAGNDFITVTETVNDVTLADFDEDDTLTITGTFEISSAQIEDTLLVITDKTGTRKIRLGDFDTAKNAKVSNGTASTTIAEWLASAGIDFNNFTVSNYSDGKVIGSSSGKDAELSGDADDGDGRIAIDPDWTPSPESVKVVREDPTKGTPSESGNILRNTSAVTIDLSTVDAAIDGDAAQKNVTGGTLSNSFPNVSTFTRNGLTIHLLGVTDDKAGGTSAIQAKTLDQLTDDQRTIVAGLFKWWGKECLTLNEESYNLGFNSPTAQIKDIGLFFYDSTGTDNNYLAVVTNRKRNTSDGVATQLMLKVNMKYYNALDSDDVNGSTAVSGAGFLDRTLAHEFNHAIFAANFNYFNALPKFIKEGVAELTHGIDDERGSTIFRIAYDADWLDGSLALDNTGTGSQSVGDGYAGGFMFWRYLAKQAAAQTLPAYGSIIAIVNLNDDGDYFIGGNDTSETAQVAATPPEGAIKLGTLKDGVYTVNDTGVRQVISATSAVKVVGLTVNDTFNGTSDADTIDTAEGSRIITGAGNDSINLRGQYAAISTGSDDDTISVVDGGHHSIDLGDGNNLVTFAPNYNYGNTITGGSGNDNITRFNGTDNVIRTGAGNDSLGTSNSLSNTGNLFDAGEGNDKITVGAGTGNTFTGGAGADDIQFVNYVSNNAEDLTAITGNYIDAGDDNDTIRAYGSNNTIRGGKGNDVIRSNGTGGNVFLYDAPFGEDIIQSFKANDSLIFAADYQLLDCDPTPDEDTGKSQLVLQIGNAAGESVGLIALCDHADGLTIDNLKLIKQSNGQIIDNTTAEFVTGTNLHDSIINAKDNASIDARAGNDVIINDGNYVTINGGTGDDSVSLGSSATNALIQYVTGDGNDTITGFSDTSTLKIGDGDEDTYATVASGDDVIVTVGEGTILLIGAANLSNLNINLQSKQIGGYTFYKDAAGNYLIRTVQDLQNLAAVVNAGNKCKGKTFRLTTDLNLSGTDYTPIGTDNKNYFGGTFDGNGHTVKNLYIPGSKQFIYAGMFGYVNGGTIKNVNLTGTNVSGTSAGGVVGYLKSGTVTNCTVSGHVNGTTAGGIVGYNSGSITDCISVVAVGNVSKNGVLVGNNNYGTVSGYYYGETPLGSNATASSSVNCTRIYQITLPEGATAVCADSSRVKTVSGKDYYRSGAKVTISGYTGGEITFDTGATLTKSDDDITVTIGGESFTVSGLTFSTTSDAFNGNKYQRTTTAGAQLGDGKITYVAAQSEDLFTLRGADNSKVTVNGNTVTITKDALKGEDIALINGEGQNYRLELASDVPKLTNNVAPMTAEAQVTGGIYTGASYGEYYTLSDNNATHYAATGGEQITIDGNISAEKISAAIRQETAIDGGQFKVKGYTVTVGGEILDGISYGQTISFVGDNVTVNFAENLDDGYRTTRDSAITPAKSDGETYTAAIETRDYYSNENGTIKHEYQVGGTTFEISGANLSKIIVDGATVKLTAESFVADEIILTDKNDAAVAPENQISYKLSCGALATTGEEITEGFTYGDGKYTYTAAGTKTFYTIDGNTVVRTPQVGGETFELGLDDLGTLTVEGGKVISSTDGEIGTLNDKIFTLSKVKGAFEAADGTTYSLTFDGKGKFALELGDDFKLNGKETIGTDGLLIQQGDAPGGLATYKYISQHNSAYTTTEGNTYTYHAPEAHDEVIISNLKAGISGNYTPEGKIFKLDENILPDADTVIELGGSKDYTLALAEGVNQKAFQSGDSGTFSGGKLTLPAFKAYYTCSGNSITAKPSRAAKEVFTLNGLDENFATIYDGANKRITIGTIGTVDINDNKYIVTFDKTALEARGTKTYTAQTFGDDVTFIIPGVEYKTSAPAALNIWLDKGDGKYSYSEGVIESYWQHSGNEYTYTAAKEGSAQVELGGLSAEPTLNGNVVTCNGTVLVESNAGEYLFDLTGGTFGGKEKTANLKFGWDGDYFYAITAADDLKNLGGSSETFKLMEDIAAPEDLDLSNFTGTLDGNNHLLSEVNGTIGGTVKNLYYRGTVALDGGTKVYTAELPDGVTVDGDKLTFGGKDYYSGTVTLTLADGIAIKGSDGGKYTFGGKNGDLTAQSVYYRVTLPAGYSVSSGETYNGYYRGSITLKAKTGFIGEDITVAIDKVTDLSSQPATFDAENIYVYADGDKYAIADATQADANDVFKVYVLTLPANVDILSGKTCTINGNVCAAADTQITIAATDGCIFTDDAQQINYTVTGNTVITAPTVRGGKVNGVKWTLIDGVLDLSACGTITADEMALTDEEKLSITAATLGDNVTADVFAGMDNITAINVSAAKFADAINALTSHKDKLTAGGSYGDGLHYALTSDAQGSVTLTVSGAGDMPNDKPWAAAQDVIKTVILGDGVTSVSGNVFNGCDALTAINVTASQGKVLVLGGKVLGTGTVNIKDALGALAANIDRLDTADFTYLGGTANAIILGAGVTELTAGTYAVKGNLTAGDLKLNGAVNLILTDGASLTATDISGGTLNIYSQGGDNIGKLTADTISSAINFNGGKFTANSITGIANLNWTDANDSITVTTYGGTVTLNKTFVAGNAFATAENIGGKEVSPAYAVTLPKYTTASGDDILAAGDGIVYVKPGSSIALTADGYQIGDYTATGGTLNGTTFTPAADGIITAETFPKIGNLAFDTTDKFYAIADAQDLADLAAYAGDTAGLTFKLTNNINLSDVENFTPINNFAGTFDGGGHLLIGGGKIFGSNGTISGYQYGTGEIDGNLTRVYKVTAPEHFTITEATDGTVFGGELYGPNAAQVTFKLTGDELTNASYQIVDKINSVTIDGQDATLTAEVYIQVEAGKACSVTDDNISVQGTAGNETIKVGGSNVTITTGAGSDLIKVAANVKTLTVKDFSAGDAIELTAVESISIFDGKLAAGELTIDGISSVATAGTSWRTVADGYTCRRETTAGAVLNGNTITYATNSNEDLFTLTGVSNTTGIVVDDKIVTLTADNLNASDVTISNDAYKLELKDVGAPKTTAAHFDGLTYKSDSTTAGYTLADNKVTYTGATSATDLFTLNGVANTAGIVVEGMTVTLTADNLNASDVTINNDAYKLELKDVGAPKTTAAHFDGLTYKSSSTTAGYTLANNKVTYTGATSATELFTLNGVSNTTGIVVDDKIVTLTADNLNASDVTISNDAYKLELKDVGAPKTTAAHFDGLTYKSASTTAGYTLANNKVTYTGATSATELFTLNGVANTAGIVVEGMTVTLTADNLNASDVTISNEDYKLALADGILSPNTIAAHFDDLTYKSSSTTAGYTLVDNKVTYTVAVEATDLFTLAGVAKTTGIVVKGATVTLTADNLNGSDVTISNNDYKLALKDVDAPKTTAAHFDGLTYKSDSTTAGYTLADNKVTYTGATSATDLFTLNGVANTAGIVVEGMTVTLTADNLNASDVTISNEDYKLALADGIPSPNTIAAHFDDLTYKSSSTTAGYTLVDNKVTYTVAVEATDLFTLAGVAKTTGIVVKGATVTLTADNLNGSDVTISNNDYKLALKDVDAPKTTAAHFDGLTYKSDSTTAGYTLADNKVTYTGATSATDLFTLNGVANTAGIVVEGMTVTLTADNLNASDVTINNNAYKLALKDVDAPKTTAAHFDGLTHKSSSTTAGYTLSDNKVTYTGATSATELFTLTGVSRTDGIVVDDRIVMLTADNLNNVDVTISNDAYKLALKDVTEPKTTAAHFDGLTYKSSSTTAGYTLADNKVTYTGAVEATELFKLNGVANTTGIVVEGSTVTLTADNLNASDVTISNDAYKLALKDVAEPKTTAAHFDGLTYKSASTTAGYTLANNKVTYTGAVEATELFKLNGVANTTGIVVEGATVTLTADNLNGSDVTISNDDYKLALKDVAEPKTTAAHFDGLTYKSASTTAGYTLTNNKVTYTGAVEATELFTLTGVVKTDGIVIDDKIVTLTADNLNGSDVTINNNAYKLALKDVDKPKTTAAHFDGLTYKSSSTTAGYTLADNKVTYTGAVEATDLFTLNGVANTAGIVVEGMTVTLTADNLNGSDVTINNNEYRLSLKDVGEPKTTVAHFDGLTYKSASTTARYTLDNNKVKYTGATSATDLFTLSGVANTTGITVEDKTVTLTANNLNGSDVTINNDDYKLALGSGIVAPSTTVAHFDGLTYKSSSTTAGYTLDNNKVTYTSATSATELFTLSGVANTTGIIVEGMNVTLTATNLNGSDVTISNNEYKLSLKDVAEPKTTAAHFDGLTYKSSSTTAGYTFADNKVTYTRAIEATELFTLSGVTNTTGIIVEDKTVKLTADNLNASDVTISNDAYKLALKDVAEPKTTVAHFDGLTYKSASTTAGYTLDNNKVKYTGAVEATDLFTLNGVASTAGIVVEGMTVTLTADNLNNADVTISNNEYKLSLKNVDAPKTTAAGFGDLVGNSTTYYTAGTTTGYTLSDDGKTVEYTSAQPGTALFTVSGITSTANVTYDNGAIISSEPGAKLALTNLGDEQLTISGFAEIENISAKNHKVADMPTNAVADGDNLIVTTADGSIVLNGAANETVNLIADDKTYTATKDRLTDVTAKNKRVTLTGGFTNNYYGLHISYGKGVRAVDASNANTETLNLTAYKSKVAVELKGSDKADNRLTGGKGNDTLTGGAGNDTLKGNAGADIFVQSGGNDTILDYTAAEDKISLTSALIDTKADGDNLIVTTSDGSIVLNGAANETVNLIAGDKTYTATKDRLTDVTAKNKRVTLTGGFTNSYYGLHLSYGKGVRAVDASNANTETLNLTAYKSKVGVKLTGATDATNRLTGGKGNDTLTGGSGNDTLKGNAGADIFVQSGGNDTILDYTAAEDKISLTSALIDTKADGDNLIITTADGDIILNGAANETVNLIADDKTYTATKDRLTDVTAKNKRVTLTGGFNSSYYGLHISYGKGVRAVDASNANTETLNLTAYKSKVGVKLTGATDATNRLTGGKGNDTLTGGSGNDTLKGNAGADIFVQSGGNDTILDYTAAEDKISLTSALIDTKADGDNLIITTADGDIILNGAANETVNLIADDKTYTATKDRLTDVTAKNKRVTLTGGFTNNYYGLHISYGKGVRAVDASNANTETLNLTAYKSKVGVKLTGATDATNRLTGGKGNDTLTGGSGNDTLKGNAGADIFVQSGGDDTILDYESEDMIQLLRSAVMEHIGNDVKFTNEDGTILVKNGADKEISTTFVDNNLAANDDELWGIDGVKDNFLFDGGNDTIRNYAAEDTINLGDYALSDLVNGAPSTADNNLVFTFNKRNSLTLSDANNISAVTFSDGTTYSRDGKHYAK